MEKWTGRVALVTGASSGIGADIARCLATEGMKVVACARNIDPIKAMAADVSTSGGQIEAVTCDLRKEEDILTMFSLIEEKYGGVDVCVNNAGLSFFSSLIDGETEKWRNILDVNVLAPCICSRETIKSLRQRGKDDGHIIHINSVSGHRVSPPTAHFYSASKHALTALTEGLKIELQNISSAIRITQISPSITRTQFSIRSRGEEAAMKMYASRHYLEAADVANAVVYALSAPPHVKIHDIVMEPTLRNKDQGSGNKQK